MRASTRHDFDPQPGSARATAAPDGVRMKRIGWARIVLDDVRQEFTDLCGPLLRRARTWRVLTSMRVEGVLLAWVVDAEPAVVPDQRLLAETEDGDILLPAGLRDGEPWWEGRWRWWRPAHWPVYLRSRRARSYVLVERN